MSRVTAPLLSLSASGKFADTLVASQWKGIPVMRQYVKPSNPDTPAQGLRRDALKAAVNAWRNYYTVTLGRSAWNRLALQLADTMSGFNAFCRNAAKVVFADADASFCSTAAAIAGYHIAFTMKNADDGATGDEAGNFEIWVGSSPSSLLLSESVAIAGGLVTGTAVLGAAGVIVYAKVRKGGYDRSGIFQLTLILA
jgi:hypothetical protein